MKKFELTSVTSPSIEFECAGGVVQSDVIKDTKKNPNFEKPVLTRMIVVTMPVFTFIPVNKNIQPCHVFYHNILIFVQKAVLVGLFSWEPGIRSCGSLFSEGLIIGGNFAFQNGLEVTIKTAQKHEDNSLKELKTASLNSPWTYIREGL